MIVAGRDDAGLAPAIPALAQAAGYPLLADPLSGARRGRAAIAHYDALLRDAGFAGEHAPGGRDPGRRPADVQAAARLGSARLDDARQIIVDPQLRLAGPGLGGGAPDPRRPARARATARGRPGMARSLARQPMSSRPARSKRSSGSELSEPNVARALADTLPSAATVFVAASMPVRDLESFWPVRDDAPRVLSNRGANGIDGTLASALGVAAAVQGPVVALIGDVAFAHDLGACLRPRGSACRSPSC